MRIRYSNIIDFIIKASNHKYIRRVPKGGGKKGYKYYYAKDEKKRSYLHGKGFADLDEIVEGASFEYTDKKGVRGHYHIKEVSRTGRVTVEHDETGHSHTFASKQEFQQFIREHHAENIQTAKQAYVDYLRKEILGNSISLKRTKRRADLLGLSVPDWEKYGQKMIEDTNDFSPLRYKIKLKNRAGRFQSKWVSESTARLIVAEQRTHWEESEKRVVERKPKVEERPPEPEDKINHRYAFHMEHAEKYEYPFTAPKEAIHPRDFFVNEEDTGYSRFKVWIRNKGDSLFSHIETQGHEFYEALKDKLREMDSVVDRLHLDFFKPYGANTLARPMGFKEPHEIPLWRSLILALEQLGIEAVFTTEDTLHVSSKEAEGSTIEDIPLSAGLPPNFLGLDLDKFKFDLEVVKKRFNGREYSFNNYSLNTEDPLLKSLGFYEALGQGSLGDRIFSALADASRGEKLSPKRLGIIGRAISRLSAWWASIGDERREQFFTNYLDKSKQYTGRLRHPLHENSKLDIPEGMEKMKTKGWSFHEYQKKAINFALSRKRIVWGMEMGLGKTLSALGLFHHLQNAGESKRMIVTAPLSAHGSWEEHLSGLSGARYKILTGATKKQRLKAYQDFKDGKLDVLVVSPEAVRIPETHKMVKDPSGKVYKVERKKPTAGDYHHLAELVDKDTLFVADEVHKYKALDSSQGEGFERLSKEAGRVVGMTGTVKPNKPLDFHTIMSRVNPDYNITVEQFREDFCILDPDTNEILAFRPDMLPLFYEINAEMLFTRSTTDSDAKIDLPERIDLSPSLKLDEKQKEVIEAFPRMCQLRWDVQQAMSKPDEKMTAYDYQVLSQMDFYNAGNGTPAETLALSMSVASERAMAIRLDQIAVDPNLFLEKDNYEIVSKAYDELFGEDYETPKLKLCMDSVQEHLETHPQTGAVVFCEYKKGLESARTALINRGFDPEQIALYHGGVSAKDRREIERKLNEGEIKVVLGQTKSLETGANLQKRANLVVHLNTPWAPDTLTQSTARVFRQGQQRKTTVLRPTGSEIERVKDRIVSRKIIQTAQATGATMRADQDVLTTSVSLEKQSLDLSSMADLLGVEAFKDLKLSQSDDEVIDTPPDTSKEEKKALKDFTMEDAIKPDSEMQIAPYLTPKQHDRFKKGVEWGHQRIDWEGDTRQLMGVAQYKGKLAVKDGLVVGSEARPSDSAFWAGVYAGVALANQIGRQQLEGSMVPYFSHRDQAKRSR